MNIRHEEVVFFVWVHDNAYSILLTVINTKTIVNVWICLLPSFLRGAIPGDQTKTTYGYRLLSLLHRAIKQCVFALLKTIYLENRKINVRGIYNISWLFDENVILSVLSLFFNLSFCNICRSGSLMLYCVVTRTDIISDYRQMSESWNDK